MGYWEIAMHYRCRLWSCKGQALESAGCRVVQRDIAGCAFSSKAFVPFKSVPPSHTTSTEQNEES